MIEMESLVEKVLQAYTAFTSFRCRATLRRTIQTDSKIESLFLMRFAFSRPKNLFLQWWLDGRQEAKHRIVLATDALVIEHSFGDMEWKQSQSVDEIVAAHAGISSGLSLCVPSLLLGSRDYSLFERVEGVEKISAPTCDLYQIVGIGSNAIKRTARVRASDLVILGMTEHFTIANGHVVCESEYIDIETSV